MIIDTKAIKDAAQQAGFGISEYINMTFDRVSVDELQAFAQLVRNSALEDAADTLYGNGLQLDLLTNLREQIRSLKS